MKWSDEFRWNTEERFGISNDFEWKCYDKYGKLERRTEDRIGIADELKRNTGDMYDMTSVMNSFELLKLCMRPKTKQDGF